MKTTRSFLLILALLVPLALLGCESRESAPSKDAPSPTKPSKRVPAGPTSSVDLSDMPKLDPRPDLRGELVKATAARDLVVTARPLLTIVSPADALSLRLAFATVQGGLSASEGLGEEQLTWSETFDALEVAVTGPDGATRTLTAAGKNSTKPAPLARLSPRTLSVGKEGIAHSPHGLKAPWAEPPAALFPGPGRYTVKLSGELALGSGPLPFETGAIDVEVKEGLKPLSELEVAAVERVKSKFTDLEADPWRSLPTMEDVKGNRVQRFSVSRRSEGYDIDFVEVVHSPEGKLLSMVSQSIFRCIAEGVPIATPSGPRPVERLAVGDEVLAFDVTRQERVVTQVRAIWSSRSNQLIRLAEDLVVSAHHPVFADGGWVEAWRITEGARLIGLDGRPRLAMPQPLARGSVVYDLAVAEPHTYFAGGVLVHNKAAQSKEAERMRSDLDFRPQP